MASHDDDRFRVRPAPPKGRAGAGNVQRSRRFVSQVLKEVSKAGATASGALGARPASTFGRGRVAAGMAGRGLGANARRVVIKSRYVVLKKAGANSVSTHLRYIERAGVARDGGGGQAYGSEADAADLNAFEERGRGDRHQFRFIVSVEDAEQLDELRSFTREFMQRMSADLETRLDWIAVDHWDTDNPHTHVVLRGRAANGQDLVIAPDYMARGMRMRASELATEWLGPRTELEIQQGLLREVEQERLTSLDRVLLQQATVDVVDLTEKPGDRQRQAVLRARLQRLEALGLAGRIDANHWRLTHHMEPTLTEMGERGDIVRTVHKALKGEQRLLALDSGRAMSVVGRIAAKGLADELDDRSYLVVDGIDGLAHYVKLPAGTDITKLPIGGIVETKPPGQERAVDRTISSLARDGVYRVADHLARLQQDSATDPQSTVDAHVRRLEALRRVGVVERVADGVWRVPGDFVSRARDHDARKAAAITVELRSYLPLEQQVRSLGATWLDQQLLADGQGLAAQGFGGHVRGAMQSRVDLLFEQGLAKRQGQRVTLARDLLATLRDRELASVGKALQNKTGLIYRPLRHGERASGVYRRSLQLASGRFAVLDNGMGFCFVPWRPVIELRLGQHLAATVRGGWASWEIGRGLGPSVG
jgi:type IV secretory pathway VirD2 relaxase